MDDVGTIGVALFAIATVVALLVRRLMIPYTVGLVLAGVLLGSTHLLKPPHLTKELLFAVFLPGLIFEAAFHLDFGRFWRAKLAIGSLAIPGVVGAMIVTAALLVPAVNGLHFVQGFTFLHGLVFGALVAATDPIAVVAIFKSLGVPRRLGVLLEGESLLNDGTAVVIFGVVLGVASGGETSVWGASRDFVLMVGAGCVVGGLVGFGIARIIHRVDDAMIEITLTTLAAYGSFIAAERLHVSGVIATVTSGMLCGNYAARSGMSPSTRLAVETFWEYVAFALNSFVFLLIGFEIDLPAVLSVWRPILVAFAAVTVARAAIIATVSAALVKTNERISRRWAVVLTWGGLRGGLSMVLALALPQGFPHRHVLVSVTFGVVILSILLQGVTMAPLLRWLRVVKAAADRSRRDVPRGEVLGLRAALDSLEDVERAHALPPDLVEDLRTEYRQRLSSAEEQMRTIYDEQGAMRDDVLLRIRRHLAVVERNAIHQAAREGVIGESAAHEISAEVDRRLAKLAHESAAGQDEG